MDDTLLMRGFERLRDLQSNSQRLFDWNRTAADPVGEGVAFDQFEHQEASLPDLLETVDRPDIRVIQRSEQPGLALEPGQSISVRGKLRRQRLDRDVASQFRVAGSPDFAHAAAANGGDDVVVSERRPDHGRIIAGSTNRGAVA
jgi:hypothetical protein